MWIWDEVQAAWIAASVASDSETERAIFSRIVPRGFVSVGFEMEESEERTLVES